MTEIESIIESWLLSPLGLIVTAIVIIIVIASVMASLMSGFPRKE